MSLRSAAPVTNPRSRGKTARDEPHSFLGREVLDEVESLPEQVLAEAEVLPTVVRVEVEALPGEILAEVEHIVPARVRADIEAMLPSKVGKRMWMLAAVVTLLCMAIFGSLAVLLTNRSNSTCAGSCLRASRAPVEPQARFTSSRYGYSLAFDKGKKPSRSNDGAIDWNIAPSDADSVYTMTFRGDRAGGRTPQELVDELHDQYAPFQHHHDIIGAEIGYVPGYGAVYEGYITPASGASQRRRLIIEAAVKADTAVELIDEGAYAGQLPNTMPEASQMPITVISDTIANTVIWKGDMRPQ